jgi:phospholipase/carboxylesterase
MNAAAPMTLSGPSRPPVTGDKPTRLVILLHGRGSNGDDLLDLQRFRGRIVPEAEFIAPNAPFPSDMEPGGFQWFSTQDRGPEMALYIGLRRARPFASIIGYSGRLIAAHLLGEELRSRPPVLLVHGTHDTRVPLQSMTEAESALQAAGVPVQTLACAGTEHSIDQEGLVRGGFFLHRTLGAPGK